MSTSQALSAPHRPWRSSSLVPPRTLSPAPPENSTPGSTSVTFKRISPISSCLSYSRIASKGLIPHYVLKKPSAISRRQAALPARYHLWLELFSHPSSYSIPRSVSEFSSRIRRNFNLFRKNYDNIFFLALPLGLLWYPNSIIIYTLLAFIIIFIAAVFFVVIVALFLSFLWNPSSIINCTLAAFFIKLTAYLFLVLIVAPVAVLSDVWLNLLVSLLIGVGIVVLHATLCKSETEDFILSEEEEAAKGGSASVVDSNCSSPLPLT